MFEYMTLKDLREEYDDAKQCYIAANQRGDSASATQFFTFMAILGEELDHRLAGNK